MRLRNTIRRALTKTVVVQVGTRKKQKRVQVPPSEQIVYLVYFAIAAFIGLTALEIVHMAFFGVWNSEIFSAITGLIGTTSGIFISQKREGAYLDTNSNQMLKTTFFQKLKR